jgi:LysR family transcriptional regulator, hydrogen peroxide-inducible genes activator
MTLAQLTYIVAVDNYRHFSIAADNCFVTQPTLSMQIQKLEEELGVLIFDRSKQPIVPTDIGIKLLKQARIILRESEKIQHLLLEETGEFIGTLKLGVIPTAAPYLIPLFLKNFITTYPKIEITIDEITTKEIIVALEKGLIDVGILALPIRAYDLMEMPLYYEPFVAYVPPVHPLADKSSINLEEIPVDDLLLLKEGHCLRDQAIKLCRATGKNWKEDSQKILFESGNLSTLKKLVEQNFGITLLPHLALVDLDIEKRKLVHEFNPPVPKRIMGFVFPKATNKIKLIESLGNIIKESVPETLLDKDNSYIVE